MCAASAHAHIPPPATTARDCLPLRARACARAAGVPPPRCVAWVEHPLYFVGRMTGYSNAWHGLEDLSHAFETYSLLGWGEEAQVR